MRAAARTRNGGREGKKGGVDKFGDGKVVQSDPYVGSLHVSLTFESWNISSCCLFLFPPMICCVFGSFGLLRIWIFLLPLPTSPRQVEKSKTRFHMHKESFRCFYYDRKTLLYPRLHPIAITPLSSLFRFVFFLVLLFYSIAFVHDEGMEQGYPVLRPSP